MGIFASRYDCKTEANREYRSGTFKSWAERLSVVCIPPLVVYFGYMGAMVVVERRREAARVRRRRTRLQQKEKNRILQEQEKNRVLQEQEKNGALQKRGPQDVSS